MALLSHRSRCAFGMVGLTVRFVGAGIPPMSDRQVHTHNMYTNANILHSIYTVSYTHLIWPLPATPISRIWTGPAASGPS